MLDESLVRNFTDRNLPVHQRLSALREIEAHALADRAPNHSPVLADDDIQVFVRTMRHPADDTRVRAAAAGMLAELDISRALEVAGELLRRSAPRP